MLRRYLLSGLLGWGLACILTLEVLADRMTIVNNGQPMAVIVLPAETEYDRWLAARTAATEARIEKQNPGADARRLAALKKRAVDQLTRTAGRTGDEEELAVTELQGIVKRLSGAELAVKRWTQKGLPPGPAILLGAELAQRAGLAKVLAKRHRDGFVCAVKGQYLILAGRRARGTLYAVYEWLESLGCRWVMPGPFGELYPEMKSITTAIDKTEDPSHSQRYWWCTYGHAKGYPRWTLRNKGNFVMALGDCRVRQGHALAGPLRWGASNTKYSVKVKEKVPQKKKTPEGKTITEMVEKEVQRLPDEYYARTNGRLNRHVPNMSNPKVWELYADYYIDYFNRNRDEEYVSASAEDGFVNDERPRTRSLDSLEFDYFMGAYAATDRLWFFLNRIIGKVEKVHPTRKFGVLVYSNNMASPRIERVHRNMALVFAPLGISPLHHVRDPKSKTNRTYRLWLEDWLLQARAVGAESYYYDYEPLGYCWNMAMICPRWAIIGKNYPWFHQLGLTGHTTQGYDDWAACGLNNYLMVRLYWDAQQGYKNVMADYAKARFGAAAPAMLEYYDILEKRMAEIPDLYSNEVWDNHLILTPKVRSACRAALRKAVKAADTARAKAHVQTMVELQRSTDAMADAIELARATGDFGKAAKMMETCWAVRDRLNQYYPNFMNRKRLDDKAKPQYFSGGIYNQYLGFDRKIKGSAAALLLPRYWYGMLDTRNHAVALGYHRPEVNVTKLALQDVTVCPDVKYQTQREVAAFFYRTTVKVPKSFAGRKRIVLHFPSVIARALEIWINGQPVKFDHGTYKDTVWRGPAYFWVNYNHEREFDVTAYIRPKRWNTIAFRVFKSFDFGGTYRRIYLLAEPPPAVAAKK